MKYYVLKHERCDKWLYYHSEGWGMETEKLTNAKKFISKEEAIDYIGEKSEYNVVEITSLENFTVKAIYHKPTKEILYSRHNHDCRWSSDGRTMIDGGLGIGDGYYRYSYKDESEIILLELNPVFLFEFMNQMDWSHKNTNANEFKEGYWGKFVLIGNSNPEFYRKLVINFEDIKKEFFY